MSCGEPHETDCREVLEEVYLYLDLECGEERRTLIRHHLDECGPCLNEYNLDTTLKALIKRSCSAERAPDTLRTSIMARISATVYRIDGS